MGIDELERVVMLGLVEGMFFRILRRVRSGIGGDMIGKDKGGEGLG